MFVSKNFLDVVFFYIFVFFFPVLWFFYSQLISRLLLRKVVRAPVAPVLLPQPSYLAGSACLLFKFLHMSSTAFELCHFYVLVFTIYLCNVTFLLQPSGEITKVRTSSRDSTEDSSVLTIAYLEKKFADMESYFSALLQE